MIQTFFLVLVWGTHSWSLFKHFRYTLCIPLDDVNITNRQQRTILCIQDKVQLWKHLYKGASVKSLHNKYCVKNDNNKWNFIIEKIYIFWGDDTPDQRVNLWYGMGEFQNYTKQGFKFEHQPSTFGTHVSAAPHFIMHSWWNLIIWYLTINVN